MKVVTIYPAETVQVSIKHNDRIRLLGNDENPTDRW